MNKTILSTVASIISSILAFLGVVTCCGMPIITGVLATLGVGASQLSFFAEYRGYFLLFAVISLLYGFYTAYFRKANECRCCSSKNGGIEDKLGKQKKLFQRSILWLGTIITVMVILAGTPNDSKEKDCCITNTIEHELINECCTNK